ncbi:BolA family protein [Undibacterium fentianense]|uniref:BolA family transcriptional regulator n=1 Tax=Undibacterium fentianense TaxID=2828728 RepID=A0A941IDR6_9BURK|nr:BolA family protein [Undibacterium fentianense]MBR7798662.1 BolA family transcriptional regulator [Undibacterium fentianense]
MTQRIQMITDRLNEHLSPSYCQIQDDSAAHKGHAGAASGAGHFTVTIISEKFAGLNRISRHRLVYDAVGDLMHTEIHALVIHASSPSEATK